MLLFCLWSFAPATLTAQDCVAGSDGDGAPAGIACPDGVEATVMPGGMHDAIPGEQQDRPAEADPEMPYNPDRAATLEAPVEAGSGSRVFVEWSGPDNTGDFITIADAGTDGATYLTYGYTNQGSPLSVTAPDEAGDYEIRYVDSRTKSILASRPILVIAASATLAAVGDVGSGASIEVSWTGPANQGDYIAISTPGTTGNQYHHYAYAQQGSPLNLNAPDEPGEYEIRYIQHQSRSILASRPVQVTATSATLEATDEVGSGASFEVSWTGPANQGDYIAIATPGTTGNQYHHYAYAHQGSPLNVNAPDEPGEYEIRYIQHQSRSILASRPVRVTATSATLATADEVGSGASFEVSWTGPANQGDYIAIATPGATGNQYHHYAYAHQGSTLNLNAPDEPGSYEVRYVQHQSRTVLATRAITVTPVSATIGIPAEARAGAGFEVSWTGPGNAGDYISVASPGTPGGDYLSYAYVQNGSPLSLTAPGQPGEYEIRYIQRQSRTILASETLRVGD